MSQILIAKCGSHVWVFPGVGVHVFRFWCSGLEGLQVLGLLPSCLGVQVFRPRGAGLGVQDQGFRSSCVGVQVFWSCYSGLQVLGFRSSGVGVQVLVLGFRCWGLGLQAFRCWGSGVAVQDLAGGGGWGLWRYSGM